MLNEKIDSQLTLTFTGTGAVYATPVLGCDCKSCLRALNDDNYERLPASLLIKTTSILNNAHSRSDNENYTEPRNTTANGTTLLIDAGHPRLEHIVRKHQIHDILLTHFHPDHIQGLFALRWGMPSYPINVIGPDDCEGCGDLFKNQGILNFNQKTYEFKPFIIGDITITPLPMKHSKLTHGYFIEHTSVSFAYLTDTNGLHYSVIDFINNKNADLCIIDCTFSPNEVPKNHNNLTVVQDIQHQLNHIPIWLTHIGHGMDTWYMDNHDKCTAQNLNMANDGMTLSFGLK